MTQMPPEFETREQKDAAAYRQRWNVAAVEAAKASGIKISVEDGQMLTVARMIEEGRQDVARTGRQRVVEMDETSIPGKFIRVNVHKTFVTVEDNPDLWDLGFDDR